MKHIDKTRLHAPAAYETELQAKFLDEAQILSHYPLKSGRELFKKVKKLNSYEDMREQLLKDQGYVCCYCNRTIPQPGHIIVTEHVNPVSRYPQWAGEYKNLLVSCDGGELIPDAEEGEEAFTRATYPLHCDKAKGDQEIPMSPLITDCETRLKYDPITGAINGDGDVIRMRDILNLNQNELKKERQKAIQNWCYTKDGNLLGKEILLKIHDAMMTRDTNGHFHNLYFVIASAAKTLAV